ncbi:MAG: [FeFe] hydrogenase H-cluster radical SAM maturase HydE [Candidatus Cloacimonetes bacterium]|nr:[FeFe] hydrogenase H-cluster radical SAM maturase HydE [Candidatus Cloacimonadota bacterium]
MRFPRPDKDEIISLLSITDPQELKELYARAYDVKTQYIGRKVWFRGIIELSNICSKDCFYCGIRSGNPSVSRYTISPEEVVEEARWCYEQGYGSIVLQAGERSDSTWTELISKLLRQIKEVSGGKLGITLSLGEQSKDIYRQWFDAGAHRYLLRVETTNAHLYKELHPPDHSFENRVKCLGYLREVGYQVGTGVMIGLPNQSLADLADDLLFFYDIDIDMIGMGPFIPHKDTPLGHLVPSHNPEEAIELGLKMIAASRIFLKDVNIASTTALQALREDGRELGLLAGANIIMPNVTDTSYRRGYQLYEGKPHLDENASDSRDSLQQNIEAIGETIAYNEWGDSAHFWARTNK